MDTQMIFTEKHRQRKQGMSARRALSPAQRNTYSRAICERLIALPAFQRAQRILIYSAFGAEVTLAPLLSFAPDKQYFYPICMPDYQMTAACPNGEQGWELGAYGIRTPILSRSVAVEPDAIDLVVVPCTAFDEHCRRVGMGAGYYDRYLPRCVNAVTIGVAFECQKTDRAAVDKWDCPLDGYVTERMFYHGKNDEQNL